MPLSSSTTMFDKITGGLKMSVFKIVVVVGLCASLLFNFLLLTRIDTVDNMIKDFSNSQRQIINTVNSQISQINNAVNKIKEDQSWLSAINVRTEIDELDKSKAMVNFEWQIKELQNDSEVVFNYKRSEEKEYTSIKAVDTGSGLFRVAIPIEVNLEPIWNSYMVNKVNDTSNRHAIEEVEKDYKRENQLIFDYYVSVSQSDMIKSAEINKAYVENMGARYYGYLEVYTDIDSDNNYSMSLTSGKIYDSIIYLEEVHLNKYRDGQLIGSEELEKRSIVHEGGMLVREDTREFSKETSDEEFDYSSLVLKVVYSDGSVFEKEVYSK